jgi:hypothetical protein
MAKSLRNLKRNWPQIKRDFKDLVHVATTFESVKGEVWPSILWGTIYAVIGTPICLGVVWLVAEIVT